MTTRKGFVAKKLDFSAQNDDEKGSRRQKMAILTTKCRRDCVSSSKDGDSRLKMTTRKGLVAKKLRFSPQNDDEIAFRHQKIGIPDSK
jgi:hypothetical protein